MKDASTSTVLTCLVPMLDGVVALLLVSNDLLFIPCGRFENVDSMIFISSKRLITVYFVLFLIFAVKEYTLLQTVCSCSFIETASNSVHSQRGNSSKAVVAVT
jgi:hypothetical protein